MSPHGQLCKWTSLMVSLLKFSEDNLRVSSYEENSFLHSSTRELFPFVFVNAAQIYLNKTGANPRNCQAWRSTEQENTSFISSCLYLLNVTLPSNKPPKSRPMNVSLWEDQFLRLFGARIFCCLWIRSLRRTLMNYFRVCWWRGEEFWWGRRRFVCFEQLYSNTAINRPLNKDWKIRPQIPFEYDVFPRKSFTLANSMLSFITIYSACG